MPIYEYRCDCGRQMDVLVRGAEPTTCSDAMEASGWCSKSGKLHKLLSAPHIATGAQRGYRSDTGERVEMSGGESCGACGMAPGSCMDS